MLIITITSHEQKYGKTTLQVLLAETLRKMGHKVTCSESTSGIGASEFPRIVEKFAAGAAERPLNPMDIHIDVASGGSYGETAQIQQFNRYGQRQWETSLLVGGGGVAPVGDGNSESKDAAQGHSD